MNGVCVMLFDQQWTDYEGLVQPQIGVLCRQDSTYKVQQTLF